MKFILQPVFIVFLVALNSIHLTQQLVNRSFSFSTYILKAFYAKTPEPLLTNNKQIVSATLTAQYHISQSTIVGMAELFKATCNPSDYEFHNEFSPDGNWNAVVCRGKEGIVDSYVRVVNTQGNKDWYVFYADYLKVAEPYGYEFYPFHWSKDGKYLYVTSGSRFSGCCWIGGDLLLARLNLETGQQTEIVNYLNSDDPIVGVDFSISANDRYVLYYPQDGKHNLYILDLYTWKQRAIRINFKIAGAGHSQMSKDEKKVIIMLRECSEIHNCDLTFGSLLLINLENGSQHKLISGFLFEDTPKPVSWIDDNHVLLERNNTFLILDINTSKIIKVKTL